jgi:flagellin
LSQYGDQLQLAAQRLSSGRRINSASDDAAGLSISDRMSSVSISLKAIDRGINDGIGLARVAQGGLARVSDLLQRARELAVQAANGVLSGTDRAALHQEYEQLLREVQRIAESTAIYGLRPLAPNAPVAPPPTVPPAEDVFPPGGQVAQFSSGLVPLARIPSGSSGVNIAINSYGADDDLQVFTKSGVHLVGTGLGDAVWSANGITSVALADATLLTQPGFDAGASYEGSNLLDGSGNTPGNLLSSSYNGMNFSYGGDLHPVGNYNESLSIDVVTEDLLVFVVGQGSFEGSGTGNWPSAAPASDPSIFNAGPIDIVLDSSPGAGVQTMTLDNSPSDLATLGLDPSSLLGLGSAQAALSQLDAALNSVNDLRGRYGAQESRLLSAQSNLQVSGYHNQAALSRILDADYALESSQRMRGQVMQTAAQTVLAQTTQNSRIALDLLKKYEG